MRRRPGAWPRCGAACRHGISHAAPSAPSGQPRRPRPTIILVVEIRGEPSAATARPIGSASGGRRRNAGPVPDPTTRRPSPAPPRIGLRRHAAHPVRSDRAGPAAADIVQPRGARPAERRRRSDCSRLMAASFAPATPRVGRARSPASVALLGRPNGSGPGLGAVPAAACDLSRESCEPAGDPPRRWRHRSAGRHRVRPAGACPDGQSRRRRASRRSSSPPIAGRRGRWNCRRSSICSACPHRSRAARPAGARPAHREPASLATQATAAGQRANLLIDSLTGIYNQGAFLDYLRCVGEDRALIGLEHGHLDRVNQRARLRRRQPRPGPARPVLAPPRSGPRFAAHLGGGRFAVAVAGEKAVQAGTPALPGFNRPSPKTSHG